MAKHSEDYLRGWKDARLQYQTTGGVQPHPPGFYGNEPEVKPKSAPKPTGAKVGKTKEKASWQA